MPNPYVNKVVYGNQTLIDLSSDDVLPADVRQGVHFHGADGAPQIGTSTGGEEVDMYAGADEPTGAVDGDLWVDTSDEAIDVEPLPVTQNGTYTAPTGKAYSPVTVNVPAVTKNVQAYTTPVNTTSTTMTNTNMKLTVSKTGTYNIYLTAGCNQNTGVYSYRLRKGSTNLVASTVISTVTGVCKVLTNQSLNSGDVLTVGLQSANSSYRAYATSLIIIEQ